MKVFELSFIVKANNLNEAIETMLNALTFAGITNECIPLKKRIKETKQLLAYTGKKTNKE